MSGQAAPGAAGALFTDLYELTMAQAYLAEGVTGPAVFEAFFRTLPPDRGYVIAAGLGEVLDWIEAFRFRTEELEYLRGLGSFDEPFLSRLEGLRFTGDVWAVPEGTVVFGGEPVLQVVAPIVEAQLIETYVLNQLHVQMVLASKAARVVEAAQGRTVVDFGSRRAHGTDAAHKAARAAYLAGAAGTSNVEAGRRYGIPVFGTMAHSFIQAFDDEDAAFDAFLRLYPGTTLLIDTFDTLRGLDRAVAAVERTGHPEALGAVRLDSGDLLALSQAARGRLDEAGLSQVRIFASSELDEHAVARLLAAGAPIDGFGVGTRMVVSADAPDLDLAYKLVAYRGEGRVKLSSEKVLHPGRKQVFREREDGRFRGDCIARHDEALPGEPLLVPVMEGGRRLDAGRADLEAARAHAARQLRALPPELRGTRPQGHYPVRYSRTLERDLEAEIRRSRDPLRETPDPAKGSGVSSPGGEGDL